MRALGFVVVVVAGLLSGCASPKCSPTNCQGCCDADNHCQLGTLPQACGASANTCVTCTPVQACNLGSCTTASVGGGSGGGSGGGTGGGAGGGTGGGGGILPVAPVLLLDRSALNFGTEFGTGTWVGTSPHETILISNGGQQALTISSVTPSGPDATAFTLVRDGTVSLSSGQQTYVRVVFSPTQPRSYSATLTVMSNAGAPVTIGLAGVAIVPPASTPQQNPECRGWEDCSSPRLSTRVASGWLQYVEDGPTFTYVDDADGDGREDAVDNCPFSSNRDQSDADGDGVGDTCDNCAASSNLNQLDVDGDGLGNSCDPDIDGDLILNATDNCPEIPNPTQLDTNGNSAGNVCDNDDDNDGILDTLDNCPLLSNPGNVPLADPGCNADADGDNISDTFDNCPTNLNATQLDSDLDGLGDTCDLDMDNDGILNQADNCPVRANGQQSDDDGDAIGDACDAKYCVVVDPNNREDCLDPAGPFRAHAGGNITLRVNDRLRLPLFANRNGAPIIYTWIVRLRPTSSTAAIVNPTGTVGLSRHWEYAYVDGRVPSLTVDRSGDYQLELQTSLAAPDRAYPASSDSRVSLRITVQ